MPVTKTMNRQIDQATVHKLQLILLPLIAWGATLLVSALPDIFFLEFAQGTLSWLIWAKIGLLVTLVVVSFGWRMLQPLRAYFVILATIYLSSELFYRVGASSWWRQWFNYHGALFGVTMLGEQLIRLAISLVSIVALVMLGFRRADFFLVQGQLAALAAPERLFGMKSPEPWTRFGLRFLLGAIGVLSLFLILATGPSLPRLALALPLLPAILFLAMLNAFNEEVTFRAVLLAPLYKVVGDRQAIYIAATLFGLGHYTGVPYGVTGVMMAAFLGWVLGKAMVETKGFFWSWIIHFVMDVMIFSLMAIGSITAGGA